MSFKNILKRRAKTANSVKALQKLHPCQIVGRPLVTEKAYKQVEEKNTYQFQVHRQANKNDVRESIKSLYDVQPISVRIMNVPHKGRFQRDLVRKPYKKAIVTLKKGDKIELAA